MVKPKENLSVGRAIVAGGITYKGCGLHAAWLQDGNSLYQNPGMRRGTAIENSVNAYMEGRGDIPEQWKTVLPDPFDTKCQVEILEDFAEGHPKIHGYVDYVCGDSVYDLKTGNLERWIEKYKIQLAIYKERLGLSYSYILHATDLDDTLDCIEVTSETTVDDLKKAWANIKGRKAEKCHHCPTCPIKKECPLWKGSDVLAQKLIDVCEKIETLEGESARLKEEIKANLEPNKIYCEKIHLTETEGYEIKGLESSYPFKSFPAPAR